MKPLRDESASRAGSLNHFIATIASCAMRLDPAVVFDPWSMQAPDDALEDAPAARQARLTRHLDRPARLVLVGEACGYAGARISGIPFTSEGLLLDGAIPGIGIDAPRLSTRQIPWREPSATIVWRALREAGAAEHAVLWNAFPWHPHPAGQPLANRTPESRERQAGLQSLEALLRAFPDAVVCGVGQQACSSLREIGADDHSPLRHPARGGARAFAAGLLAVVRRMDGRSLTPPP